MRQSTLDMDDLRGRRSLVITRKEAAEALGVDPRTITTSINEGHPACEARSAHRDPA